MITEWIIKILVGMFLVFLVIWFMSYLVRSLRGDV